MIKVGIFFCVLISFTLAQYPGNIIDWKDVLDREKWKSNDYSFPKTSQCGSGGEPSIDTCDDPKMICCLGVLGELKTCLSPVFGKFQKDSEDHLKAVYPGAEVFCHKPKIPQYSNCNLWKYDVQSSRDCTEALGNTCCLATKGSHKVCIMASEQIRLSNEQGVASMKENYRNEGYEYECGYYRSDWESLRFLANLN
jgi:hypothetical protein